MTSRILLLLAGFIMTQSVMALTEGSLDPGMVNPGHHEQPTWFKNSFLDISDDIADASKHNRRLVLYFYQDGCPYCKKLLDENFSQKAIVDKMRKNFDVVTINLWGDREVTANGNVMSEKEFAAQLKVMYTPTLIFFGEDSKPVLRANGFYPPEKFNVALDYAMPKQVQKETFGEYLQRKSPKPASGKIHRDIETSKAPYQFNKPMSKGVTHRIVMFEQKLCPACDELHQDILQRDVSKQLLKKFDVSVLDIWSDDKVVTTVGVNHTARDLAKKMNIQYAPSMVFLDKTGKEVFRADGYLKAFHIQSAMDYVASGDYSKQPNFQRYIEARAAALRARGETVDIMN